VAGALTHQTLPLMMEAPSIFFLGLWRANHAAKYENQPEENVGWPELRLVAEILRRIRGSRQIQHFSDLPRTSSPDHPEALSNFY
jgi:hypothetical protein